MIRAIEFRAWQPHPSLDREPGMYAVTGIEFYKEYGGGEAFLAKIGESFDTSDSSEFFQDIVLLQYTGTKDKNGEKLFDGDIVKMQIVATHYKKEFTSYICWGHNGGWFTQPVGWRSQLFGKPTEEGIEPLIPLDQYNTEYVSEKIGNIYENPELVKL